MSHTAKDTLYGHGTDNQACFCAFELQRIAEARLAELITEDSSSLALIYENFFTHRRPLLESFGLAGVVSWIQHDHKLRTTNSLLQYVQTFIDGV